MAFLVKVPIDHRPSDISLACVQNQASTKEETDFRAVFLKSAFLICGTLQYCAQKPRVDLIMIFFK